MFKIYLNFFYISSLKLRYLKRWSLYLLEICQLTYHFQFHLIVFRSSLDITVFYVTTYLWKRHRVYLKESALQLITTRVSAALASLSLKLFTFFLSKWVLCSQKLRWISNVWTNAIRCYWCFYLDRFHSVVTVV